MDVIALLEGYRGTVDSFWKRLIVVLGLLLLAAILAYYSLLVGLTLILAALGYLGYLVYRKQRLKKLIVSRISQIIALWNQGYRIAIYDGGDRVLLLNEELDIELGPYVIKISQAPGTPGMVVDFGYVFLNGSFAVRYASNYSELYLAIYLRNKGYTLSISPEGIQEHGDKEFFEEHFGEQLEKILNKFKSSQLTVMDLIEVSKEISRKALKLPRTSEA